MRHKLSMITRRAAVTKTTSESSLEFQFEQILIFPPLEVARRLIQPTTRDTLATRKTTARVGMARQRTTDKSLKTRRLTPREHTIETRMETMVSQPNECLNSHISISVNLFSSTLTIPDSYSQGYNGQSGYY